VISHDEDKIIDHVNRVPAREYMDISYFHINNLTHIDVDPAQMFSPSTAIIPFVQNDDSSRANMGTNQQRQAVPLVKPEAPLIGTGFEKDVLQ
jgi:DNA-directed RNA polymerase subunit beta